MKFVKRVTLFFCISEMMPVHWTYCDNHFMMYVKSNHYALYFKHMQWYMPIISQLEGKRKKKGRKGKGKKKFTFRLCHRHFSWGPFLWLLCFKASLWRNFPVDHISPSLEFLISPFVAGNGMWEDGHVPGFRRVPRMGHQARVLGFTQERIQEWGKVKSERVYLQR